MRELTYKAAKEFVTEYKAFTSPSIGGSISLSYNDGYAASALLKTARYFGFSSMEEMNKASKAYLKTHPAPAPAKRQKARIEVVKYMGTSSGFSSTQTTRYKVDVVGVNGKRQSLNDWQDEGYGTGDSDKADEIAGKWAALLGCKIVLVDETKTKAA